MHKWKKEIVQIGNYTIDPINLKILLTQPENYFFNTLIYFEDIKQMYVSLSILEIYNSMTRPTVLKTKNNLIQLDFIEIKKDTQKGTIYKIKWENVTNILKRLSDESNVIKRLAICDNYRTNKGLSPLNKNNITKYENSPFDNESNKIDSDTDENVIEKNENKKKLVKSTQDNLLLQFNEIQHKKNECKNLNVINDLNNELNRLKMIAKSQNKIMILNKELNQWQIKK